MAPVPYITVILPVWNGADTIATCLTALTTQDYPADRYEICVVDNGSTDGTAAIVRGFGNVRLLHEPRPSSYAARNCGLATATGDYVAFTDADCTPTRGWLSAAIRAARARPDAAIIGGPIELYEIAGGSAVAAAYERLYPIQQEVRVTGGYCVTANWVSPLAVLVDLGGFDATLRSGGDFDLSERVRATGAAVAYAPEMVVRHPARPSIAALAQKRRRTSAGVWQRRPGIGDRIRMTIGLPIYVARGFKLAMTTRGLTLPLRCAVAATVLWLGLVQLAQTARMVLRAPAPRS